MQINIDKVKVIKITGITMSIAGTLIAGWVGDKEAGLKLEKLVNDRFKNK